VTSTVTAAATTAAKTSRAIVRLLISLSATDRRAPLRLHFYLIACRTALKAVTSGRAVATGLLGRP
jgi:hypothetical protein